MDVIELGQETNEDTVAGHAKRKIDNLDRLRVLLYTNPPMKLADIIEAMPDVSRNSIILYLKDIGATKISYGYYTLEPTEDDVALAQAILKKHAQQLDKCTK